VTGTGALATIVALWALHFAASGRLLDRYVEATADPILAARRTVNGLLVSVAGLVAVAVANELVIAHPHGQASVALSLLLFGGPLLYLLSQTVYLWAVVGWRSLPRLAGVAALVVAGGLSQPLPCLRSPGAGGHPPARPGRHRRSGRSSSAGRQSITTPVPLSKRANKSGACARCRL
jgi:hypothetical protein